jgi:hypothetical protein
MSMKKYGSNKTYGSNKPNLSIFSSVSGVSSLGFSAFPSFSDEENLTPSGGNTIRAPTFTKEAVSLYNDVDEGYNPGKAKKKRATSQKHHEISGDAISKSTDTSFSSSKGTERQKNDKKVSYASKTKYDSACEFLLVYSSFIFSFYLVLLLLIDLN